jgi:hypothetical protein
MHQLILGTIDKKGIIIDHINGDGLDNRKENLRICTHSQNHFNSNKYLITSSIYKGVTKVENGKWIAHLSINKKHIYIGIYKRETDAAVAYDNAARKYFKDFARVNFPKYGEQCCLINQ